jgi:hypothetical protein
MADQSSSLSSRTFLCAVQLSEEIAVAGRSHSECVVTFAPRTRVCLRSPRLKTKPPAYDTEFHQSGSFTQGSCAGRATVR